MLKHHADSEAARLSRVAHGHALSLPDQLPRVSVDDAVDDLHQRTFARTVFTKQGMDFARGDAQVDVIVGQAARVALADAAQLQARRLNGMWHGIGHDRLSAMDLCLWIKQFSGHWVRKLSNRHESRRCAGRFAGSPPEFGTT